MWTVFVSRKILTYNKLLKINLRFGKTEETPYRDRSSLTTDLFFIFLSCTPRYGKSVGSIVKLLPRIHNRLISKRLQKRETWLNNSQYLTLSTKNYFLVLAIKVQQGKMNISYNTNCYNKQYKMLSRNCRRLWISGSGGTLMEWHKFTVGSHTGLLESEEQIH